MKRFEDALPAGLRKWLEPARIREAASCARELSIVDARSLEVLERIKEHDPMMVVGNTRISLGLLRLQLEQGQHEGAMISVERLEQLLGEQVAVATGWDELHRLFDTKAKLSRAEQGYQKMLSENILLDQVTTFIAALVAEARMLTDDRKRLSEYAQRVRSLGLGIVAGALGPGDENVEDVEVVTAVEAPEVEP